MALKAEVSESYNIEDYSNYDKEDLYSRKIKWIDGDSGKVLRETEIVFVDYLEEVTLKVVMKECGVDDYNVPSFVNPDSLKRLVVFDESIPVKSNDALFVNNWPVYRYFKLTEEQWDSLTSDAYGSLYDLADLLEIEDVSIFSIKVEKLVEIIDANLNKVNDKSVLKQLKNFLSLPVEQQDLILHDINSW